MHALLSSKQVGNEMRSRNNWRSPFTDQHKSFLLHTLAIHIHCGTCLATKMIRSYNPPANQMDSGEKTTSYRQATSRILTFFGKCSTELHSDDQHRQSKIFESKASFRMDLRNAHMDRLFMLSLPLPCGFRSEKDSRTGLGCVGASPLKLLPKN